MSDPWANLATATIARTPCRMHHNKLGPCANMSSARFAAIFRSILDRACTQYIIPHVVLQPIVDLFWPSLATLCVSHLMLWGIFFIVQSTATARLAKNPTATGYLLNPGVDGGHSSINTARVMYIAFIVYWTVRAAITYTIRVSPLCKADFQNQKMQSASASESSRYLETLLASMNSH